MQEKSRKSGVGISKSFRLYSEELDYLVSESKNRKTNQSTVLRGLIRSEIKRKKAIRKNDSGTEN